MTEMRFRNFGGIHQFMVSNEDDLARIDDLDPARWAATSAPLSDLHCDPAFLRYIDHETTGRVRVAQIIEARDWLFSRLGQRDVLRKRVEAIASRPSTTRARQGPGCAPPRSGSTGSRRSPTRRSSP
ncbi:MAG: hypothetical protein IPN17_30430 [Deltaproteobacteria bacterium]|nr:hypothetical protein [Deltaproteobacteria bacterium]